MASGTRTRTLISRLGSWIFGMAQRVRFRYDFFISYAHGDGRAYADNLTRQLRDLDFVCFRDKDELPPGLVLRPSLRRAITASAQMIVVGSTDAIASDYVALEVETFSNTSRPIVPIDFGGTLTEAPWPLLRDQEVIWIDESPAALERGAPSPLTIAAVEKSFEFTKRNTLLRVRAALIAAIFVSGVAVAFLLLREEQRNASALTRLAETERIRAHRATARAMFERQVADRQGQIAAKNIKLARERLIDTAQEQGRLELLAGRSLPALLYLRDVYAARPQNEVARFLTRAATHGIVPEISPVFDRPKGLSFLEPVPGNLREASWSPGGDRILLRDARHTRVFDRQGRLLVALQRDGVPVVSSFVAFLDARRMLTADSVRASIWSTDGKLLRDVPLKEGIEPTWFALPLDRTTLVVSARGGVLFVPLSGGASRWVPVDKELYVVDRQGKRVAVIDGSSIRIRDLSSGTQSGTLSASRPVIWAFWSTGGDLLVAMHEDWTATLLRVEDAKARPLDGHTGEIRVVDFSPDGRWLVTGGEDGLLFLWDVDSLSDATYEPRALRGHTGIVHAAHFSPDSRRLLTATHLGDTTARVWDVRTGTVQMLLETYFSMIPLAFSPDSTHVVTTASTGFSAPIWDLRRDLRDAVITDVDGFAYADLAANGDAVVVQAKDNLIVRYDVRSRRATSCPSLIENEQASMPELTADPYIVKVSLGLSGGALIDMRRCAVLSSFPVEDLGTKLTVLPRQHRYLITRNGGVELRNFHGRSPLRRFETEKQARHSADKLTLSADGRALLVEGFDTKEGGNARRTSVWDLRTGVMRFAVAGMQAIWSPNGELIAVVVEDPDDTPLPNRFVHVIAHDARTGRQLSDFKVSLYSIQQIIFSPDSTRILSTSRDTTARVSDARTGKQMIALPGHANHATRGAFSPTGGRIVTADAKFNLRIWDAAYGRLLAVLTGHSARIDEVAFTSDGASIVSVAAPEYMGPPSPEHTEVLRWDVGLETRSVAEIDTLIRQWMPDSVRESVLPRTSAAIRAR